MVGTRNVISLCKKHNVKYLVYTSDLCIDLIPFTKGAIFAAAVNYTESSVKVPEEDKGFLFSGYPYYKAKADKMVLDANGQLLENGGK